MKRPSRISLKSTIKSGKRIKLGGCPSFGSLPYNLKGRMGEKN